MRRTTLFILLLLPPAVAPAQAPANNRVEAPAPPPDWEDMILSVPGMRGAIPAAPQEKAFTTPALTLTESRIAAELQLSEERTLAMPGDVLRRNLSEARLLLASNLVYQASRSFWAAHRAAPGNAEAVEGMAVCMLRANDNDRAARLFEWLILRNPSNAVHRVNLASALYQGGHARASVVELRRLINDRAAPANILHYNLAMSLQSLGEIDAALEALEDAAAAAPSDPVPRMASARLCARQGREPAMLEHLRQARDLASASDYEFMLQNAAFSTHRPAIRKAALNRGRPNAPPGSEP
jgi:tetratricopeptide (TPR) repeat protein